MTVYLGILGSGSSVGKSTLTTALGRQLADAGLRVAPFKAQNMATNAAPALRDDGDWGEIGTAQYVQAVACRQPPLTSMNPVLLKPLPRGACETVVDGRVIASEGWASYRERTAALRVIVRDSLARLERQTSADVVLIEGAGSCVELNLHSHDLGNLNLLRELDAPWLLVADIDRGGIYAQVVGTMTLLPDDWSRCIGVVVNRLRGDPAFFADGADDLAARVGRPVYVISELADLHLPDEDTADLFATDGDDRQATDPSRRQLVVVRLPNTAMSGDLAPIANDPLWQLQWREQPPAEPPDAVIIPGSKHSGSDLIWLQQGPWATWLHDYAREGGRILGLCGGYQLLGEVYSDPDGRDGPAGERPGLGLLPVRTRIGDEKIIRPRNGRLADGTAMTGYEIRWGRTERSGGEPLIHFDDGDTDGCQDGTILGTYLHGALASSTGRSALLGAAGTSGDDPIDRLAAHCRAAGLLTEDILQRWTRP